MFHSEIQKSTATFLSFPTLTESIKILIYCSHLLRKPRRWYTVNSELNIKYEILFYLGEPAFHSRFSITVRNTNRTTHLYSQDTL